MKYEWICYAIAFAAEAMIVWIYCSAVFEKKRSVKSCIAAFCVVYLALYGVSFFDVVAANAAAFFFINIALICFSCHCRLKNAVLHGAYLCLIMCAAEILTTLFLNFFFHDFAAYQHNFLAMCTNAIICKLLFLMLAVLSSRIFSADNSSDTPAYLINLCITPAASISMAVAVTYIGIEYSLDVRAELMLAVSIFLLLAANVLILLAYNHTQRLNSEYAAMQISRQREIAEIKFYEMMQQHYDNQRALIHDMGNHFNVIYALAEDGKTDKIEKYIDTLKASPEFKSKKRLSADPILNIILLRYSDLCTEKGVRLTTDIRYAVLNFIDSASITALFGNLLSNAIEAAVSSEARIVELTAVRNDENSVLLISAINSCDREPDKKADGEYVTHKPDKGKHGYGLKSINRVVSKYNGKLKMYYDSEAREFHSIIQFPIR